MITISTLLLTMYLARRRLKAAARPASVSAD